MVVKESLEFIVNAYIEQLIILVKVLPLPRRSSTRPTTTWKSTTATTPSPTKGYRNRRTSTT
jgi:hypothetical protein